MSNNIPCHNVMASKCDEQQTTLESDKEQAMSHCEKQLTMLQFDKQ